MTPEPLRSMRGVLRLEWRLLVAKTKRPPTPRSSAPRRVPRATITSWKSAETPASRPTPTRIERAVPQWHGARRSSPQDVHSYLHPPTPVDARACSFRLFCRRMPGGRGRAADAAHRHRYAKRMRRSCRIRACARVRMSKLLRTLLLLVHRDRACPGLA
eukprot:366043-Chlamydomonas_euryale.AAC.7